MARNGAGIYTPPATSFPAVSGTLIESTKFNETINDLATAVTGSLSADGQTTATGNLAMGGYRITGLGAAVGATDSARLSDVLDAVAAVCSTGDIKLTLKAAADTGWVMFNDTSIGDATSGATGRAHSDTSDLFTLLWTNIADEYCPVSGGRGASAAADYAAHKTLALPKALGRALAIAGSGSGLTARALGLTVGEEAHQLTTVELASHNHDITDPTHSHGVTDPGHIHHSNAATNSSSGSAGAGVPVFGSAATSSNTTGISINGASTGITAGSTGSGTAHNNMQPTTFLNAMVKL